MKLPRFSSPGSETLRPIRNRDVSFGLRNRILASLLTLALAVVAGKVLTAQEKQKLPGEDWVSLFNGNDLTGWTKVGNESWTFENGVIHGKGLTQAYGYLETKKYYKDSSAAGITRLQNDAFPRSPRRR